MSKRLVHIARSGNVIGQYPTEQLASLVDSGFLLDSDFCYSSDCPEWTPVPEFLKKLETPKYLKVGEGRSNRPGKGYSGRGHRGRRNLPVLISGWVAFLLVLSVLVGAGFWISGLYDELGQQNIHIRTLEEALAQKEKENQRLLFASREIAETGVVRGSVILRGESRKPVAMPGVQVFLFPRKTIVEYLERKTAEGAGIPEEKNADGHAFFTADLPAPLASTTTDANGRFEFPVPEPGEYVIHARINISEKGEPAAKIWFVGFNSQEALNTLVRITEANCVHQFVPSLMIVEGR